MKSWFEMKSCVFQAWLLELEGTEDIISLSALPAGRKWVLVPILKWISPQSSSDQCHLMTPSNLGDSTCYVFILSEGPQGGGCSKGKYSKGEASESLLNYCPSRHCIPQETGKRRASRSWEGAGENRTAEGWILVTWLNSNPSQSPPALSAWATQHLTCAELIRLWSKRVRINFLSSPRNALE